MLTSLAICSGLFVHATISALGVSLILLQSAWAGKGLAVSAASGARRQRVSPWRPLREGLLSNVLNPKTVVFYMAFLPQFIAPTDPALLKSLWLAGIHFVIANLWQILVAVLVGSASHWLARPAFSRVLNGLTGGVLVAFGVKLALTRAPS